MRRIDNLISNRLVSCNGRKIDDVIIFRQVQNRLLESWFRGFRPFIRIGDKPMRANTIGNSISYHIMSLKHLKIQDFTKPWPFVIVEKSQFSRLCFLVFLAIY